MKAKKDKPKPTKSQFLLSMLEAADTCDINGKRDEFPATVFLSALFQFGEDGLRKTVLADDACVSLLASLTDHLAEFLKIRRSDKMLINDSLFAAFCCGAISQRRENRE